MRMCIHYLACGVFIYLPNALLYWTFWLFPWTILLPEINVLFKWFISFSINLGTKIKLTFSENKGAVELENIYSEIKKKMCLLRAQFLLKNKHHRPPEKEEKPPADTFSHWLMMLSWQSSLRNGNQGTNGLDFIQ